MFNLGPWSCREDFALIKRAEIRQRKSLKVICKKLKKRKQPWLPLGYALVQEISHQRKSKLTPQSDSWNYQGRRLWLICITWLRCDYIYWYVNIRVNLTQIIPPNLSLRIAYSLFHGLFSSASPQAIYSSTCDIIKNDSEVSFKRETYIGNADNINNRLSVYWDRE